MPLASIVIPTYNHARFLSDALRSAIEQTLSNIEVLIIDDGSTDQTQTIVEPFMHDSRCRYIRQENAGVAAARNRGLLEASGTYIHFLDADDWLAPNFLELLVAKLESHPNVSFAYSDIVRVYQAGTNEDRSFSVAGARSVLAGDIFDSLLIGGYFPPHCVVTRHSVLDALGGFDPMLGGNADWELWLRIAGSGHQATFIDQKLAFYRIHGANMSSDHLHMRDTRTAALQKVVAQFPARVADALASIAQHSDDLYAANRWLDDQQRSWAAELAHATEANDALQKWIEELEGGKAWLDTQYNNWKEEAERLRERELLLEQQNATLGQQNATLGQQNATLEQQNATLQQAIDEFRKREWSMPHVRAMRILRRMFIRAGAIK